MKRNQIIIIVAILSLLILFIGILVAWNTPATGFEPSIYTATPLIFWIAVSLNLILANHYCFLEYPINNALKQVIIYW